MEFRSNPIKLGLEYHSSAEITNKEGNRVIRFVLSNKPTSDQLKEISKYSNLKLVRDGATYKYAPEIKYDVLYQSLSDDESSANEDFEDEHLGFKRLDRDNSSEIFNALDNEGGELSDDLNLEKYASITSTMSNVNDLILILNGLKNRFPENSKVFDTLIESLQIDLGRLSALIGDDKDFSENMEQGIDETRNQLLDNSANEGVLETTFDDFEKRIKDLVIQAYNDETNKYKKLGYKTSDELVSDALYSDDSILPFFDEGDFSDEEKLKILNSEVGGKVIKLLLKTVTEELADDEIDEIFNKIFNLIDGGNEDEM